MAHRNDDDDRDDLAPGPQMGTAVLLLLAIVAIVGAVTLLLLAVLLALGWIR